MKTYKLSFAASTTHVPANPERTALKQGSGMDFDITYQVWTNRAAMLKTIEIQERNRCVGQHGWVAVQR